MNGAIIQLTQLPYLRPGFSIRQDGGHIMVTLDNGVVIYYNGNADGRVCVPRRCKGALSGICGNFDGYAPNDLMTSAGVLVSDSPSGWQQIGHSWLIHKK